MYLFRACFPKSDRFEGRLMLGQKPNVLLAGAEALPPPAEADYTPHDVVVTVTGLPSTGVILKSDQLTRVCLGDALTAAELAALSLAPAEGSPGTRSVIYVP